MTRVNVVPPSELCDQHLLAELREIKRIPNSIFSGKIKIDKNMPPHYVLGEGHIKFFTTRIRFLGNRYTELLKESRKRGFNTKYLWPIRASIILPQGDYEPSAKDYAINRQRIRDQIPKVPRYYGKVVDASFFK